VNVALVDPNPTVTEAGTVSAPTLLESDTALPPAGAAGFTETVQVDVPAEPKDPGEQLSAVRVGAGIEAVTVPPTPLIASPCPSALDPSVPPTPIEVLTTVAAIVTVTTATVPFCMTELFSPATRQLYEPAPPLQLIDLPAAEALPPAAALIDTTSDGEYVSVH
jgi:hypothetical protein